MKRFAVWVWPSVYALVSSALFSVMELRGMLNLWGFEVFFAAMLLLPIAILLARRPFRTSIPVLGVALLFEFIGSWLVNNHSQLGEFEYLIIQYPLNGIIVLGELVIARLIRSIPLQS